MSTLTIQLPDSLRLKLDELARAEGIPPEQFVASATAEKMAALLSGDFLRREAALGSREEFIRVLRKAPHVAPQPDDVLPSRRNP